MKKQLRLLAFLLTVCSLSYAWWIQSDGQVLESLNSTFSGTDVPLEETVEENIRLATFNIQVFGVKKLEKPKAIGTLARIVRRFQIVAVQEIRSADQSLLDRFLQLVNSDGSQFDYVLGPRLGRTSSKEQYAFLFDKSRIEVIPGSVYTINDPHDLLHREPLVARFRVRIPDASEGTTFTLINVHTDPDDVKLEINLLDNVMATVRRDGSGEDDVILLGDLNADTKKYGDLLKVPNLTWAVKDVTTNTRRTKAYDNILFDGTTTLEFTGRSGVFNIMDEFHIDEQEALEISDHLPVWAEFRAREIRRTAMAGQPALR